MGTTLDRRFVSRDSPGLTRAGAGGRPCQGVYYHREGTDPRVAFLAAHYDVDFSEHYLAEPLAKLGYGFLGWNTRFRGAGIYFSLAEAIDDIAVGVRYLREVAEVDTVVLLGNSGGASLMAAYQAAALKCHDDDQRRRLLPGQLFVSLNAHRGRPDVLTSWMDPSVTDETDPLSRDAELDLFAERAVPLPAEWLAHYRSAQYARNTRITDWVSNELARLAESGARDRIFPIFRTWADPRFLDLTIDPSDRRPGCYRGDAQTANLGVHGLAAACTCRSWLEMWSLAHSSCRAEPHLATITEPALVVQSTEDQGCFPSDARAIYEALASTDKALVWVPGDHYLLEPAEARAEVAGTFDTFVRERVEVS